MSPNFFTVYLSKYVTDSVQGSTTARALACLIDRIGIPDDKAIRQKGLDTDDICRDLYHKYINGRLRKPRVSGHLKGKYKSKLGWFTLY